MNFCVFNLLLFFNLFTAHLSIELYGQLRHLIEYVENHTDAQKPDLMLGIYLCEAQLNIVYLHHNRSHTDTELITVMKEINHLREQYEHRVLDESSKWESNVHNSIVVQHLLNFNFWNTSLQENNESEFFGNLSTNYPLSLTVENFAEFIDSGAPSPTESDECLAELLNSVLCTISVRCLQIMSLNNESHGYHLTHKLLYFMVLKYRNCGQCLSADGMSLNFMIYTLCAMIQHEWNLIINMKIPNSLKDLFLEQTLLCGLNGYAVFINESTGKKIGQWQVPESGCFEYFDGILPTNIASTGSKSKRNAILLKGNCSDHMTGLAAATFGLFAKTTNQFYANVF